MKAKYIIKKDVDAKAFSTKYTRDIYVLKTKIAHVEDKIRITEDRLYNSSKQVTEVNKKAFISYIQLKDILHQR